MAGCVLERDGVTIGFDSKGFSRRCDLYLLSHGHTDHMNGLSPNWQRPVLCSEPTKRLLVQGADANIPKYSRHCPRNRELLVPIETGEEQQHGSFTVLALEAGHCPGALMFIITGGRGKHAWRDIYTGDMRLSDQQLRDLPAELSRAPAPVSTLYLDDTFCDPRSWKRIPSRHEAVQLVCASLRRHPSNARIFLDCSMVGTEMVLCSVAREEVAAGRKLGLPRERSCEMRALLAEEFEPAHFSENLDGCRVVCIPVGGGHQSAQGLKCACLKCYRRRHPDALLLKPSTQWFGTAHSQLHSSFAPCVDRASTIEHICYAIHSSFEELESFVRAVSPARLQSLNKEESPGLQQLRKHCQHRAHPPSPVHQHPEAPTAAPARSGQLKRSSPPCDTLQAAVRPRACSAVLCAPSVPSRGAACPKPAAATRLKRRAKQRGEPSRMLSQAAAQAAQIPAAAAAAERAQIPAAAQAAQIPAAQAAQIPAAAERAQIPAAAQPARPLHHTKSLLPSASAAATSTAGSTALHTAASTKTAHSAPSAGPVRALEQLEESDDEDPFEFLHVKPAPVYKNLVQVRRSLSAISDATPASQGSNRFVSLDEI